MQCSRFSGLWKYRHFAKKCTAPVELALIQVHNHVSTEKQRSWLPSRVPFSSQLWTWNEVIWVFANYGFFPVSLQPVKFYGAPMRIMYILGNGSWAYVVHCSSLHSLSALFLEIDIHYLFRFIAGVLACKVAWLFPEWVGFSYGCVVFWLRLKLMDCGESESNRSVGGIRLEGLLSVGI